MTRAMIMAVIYFGAILFEREPDLPTTFGAAAFIILALQPTALLEPGFQLSFLTVFTLIVTMPVWDSWWTQTVVERVQNKSAKRAAHCIGGILGLSLLAQLGALPIVALTSNEISVSGILANLCIVPILFVLIPLGFLGCLAWVVYPPLGAVFLGVAGWGLQYIAAVVHWFGGVPWAYLAVAPPNPALIIGYYLVVIGLSRAIGARLALRDLPGTATKNQPEAQGLAGIGSSVNQ